MKTSKLTRHLATPLSVSQGVRINLSINPLYGVSVARECLTRAAMLIHLVFRCWSYIWKILETLGGGAQLEKVGH